MTESEISSIVDRFLIRDLIDEYSNVCTLKAWDRLADLFVETCAWRTRGTHQREFLGRAAVVKAITSVVESYPLVFQMPHALRIFVNGDRATATTLLHEYGKVADSVTFALGIYHDKLIRTDQGWKFEERVFEGVFREAPR